MKTSSLSRREALTASTTGITLAILGSPLFGHEPKSKKKGKLKAKSPPEESDDADSDLDDLTRDILLAQDAFARTEEMQAFLGFIETGLSDTILSRYSDVRVFRQVVEASSPNATCRTWKLGETPLPNQSRVHKHGNFDYRYETRSVKAEVFAEICHPDIDDIRGDVEHCLRVAGTTAVITAVVTESPSVGYAIFFPVFRACLIDAIGDRAKQVSARLFSRNQYACWTNHCG